MSWRPPGFVENAFMLFTGVLDENVETLGETYGAPPETRLPVGAVL